MIKSDINNAISNPNSLEGLSLQNLQEVISEFPYFSAAQLLLTKKLKEEDSLLFENQLNLTAAYVPSRKVMYDLLHIKKDRFEVVSESKINEAIEESIKLNQEVKQTDELEKIILSETQLYSIDTQIGKPEGSKTESESSSEKNFGESHQFIDWLSYFESNTFNKEKSQHDIIDEFISNEPRLPFVKQSDAPVENLAKSSQIDIDNFLVTETLAKIHLDQGNRSKAIEIYERLMLKYPEKSAYFAAQIEFLKQK